MKYGKFLEKGNTIGVCAPSLGCPLDPYRIRYIKAKEKFNELGYQIKETNSVYTIKKARSNNAYQRAKEFESLWFDDSVDFIFSIAGGEFMMEILPYIHFDKIKNSKPKYFMGYSDNTCLTFLLTTLCDVATIYGYHIGEFGAKDYDKSTTRALELIEGDYKIQHSYDKIQTHSTKWIEGHELDGFNLTKKTEWKSFSRKDEVLEGRIIGGCLDVLITLCGTKFDKVKDYIEKYKDDGIIWYFESCDLNIFSQARAFFQLEQAGWLKYCKGIILGRPLRRENQFGLTYFRVIKDQLKHLNVPVIYDVDVGHVSPSLSIINGAKVKVTYKNKLGTIETILE